MEQPDFVEGVLSRAMNKLDEEIRERTGNEVRLAVEVQKITKTLQDAQLGLDRHRDKSEELRTKRRELAQAIQKLKAGGE